MSNNDNKNFFAVFGLLFGALCWGIVWYPYRIMSDAGMSGIVSSFYTYSIAVVLARIIQAVSRHCLAEHRCWLDQSQLRTGNYRRRGDAGHAAVLPFSALDINTGAFLAQGRNASGRGGCHCYIIIRCLYHAV